MNDDVPQTATLPQAHPNCARGLRPTPPRQFQTADVLRVHRLAALPVLVAFLLQACATFTQVVLEPDEVPLTLARGRTRQTIRPGQHVNLEWRAPHPATRELTDTVLVGVQAATRSLVVLDDDNVRVHIQPVESVAILLEKHYTFQKIFVPGLVVGFGAALLTLELAGRSCGEAAGTSYLAPARVEVCLLTSLLKAGLAGGLVAGAAALVGAGLRKSRDTRRIGPNQWQVVWPAEAASPSLVP